MQTMVAERMTRLLRTLVPVLLMALASIAPAASGAENSDVLRATLKNGLRVVIVRNTLAPVVTTSVNYLVGSDETPAGFPGTAHAQEHMMFRGTPGLSADQLADIGSLMGGQFNADTRESLTQYLFTVPAQDLDTALHVEALRMQGVLDTQDAWDHERGAIEQEVARDLSSPFYVLFEKLRTLLFKGTVYEHDALGTRPSFEKTDAAMLKNFHDKWYAPNNAILVIVGDLNPKATLSTVTSLFGSIPQKRLPARPHWHLSPVVPQTLNLPTDYASTTDVLALRTSGLDSADLPALEILADVLNSHRFALYSLVPQGKAIATEVSLDPLGKAGLMYAVVSLPSSGDAAAMLETMRSILAQAAKTGISPDLVAAAKLQEERDTEFNKTSIEQLASVWSDAIALYGLDSPEADLARIRKVTVADVNRVARKYLDIGHAISAIMQPQNSGAPVSSGGFGGQEEFSLPSEKQAALPDWAAPLLHGLAAPASTLAPVVSTLPNGLTLIVVPESASNTVSVYGHIRNRPETEEPKGQEGVSLMLDGLWVYGTQHLDRLAYQSALDGIGADEDAGADFHVKALARYYEQSVALLADNELSPVFSSENLESTRARVQPYVASRNTTPDFLTRQALRQALFPPDDPSLLKATPESIGNITLDDVKAYYQKVFRPDLTTIVVMGNITPERARAAIEKYFGVWSASGPQPVTTLPAAPPNKSTSVAVPDQTRVQDAVYLAQTMPLTRSDPDYYALSLGNALLSGGFYSSRLSNDLRKTAGLVYTVDAQIQSGRTRSIYLVNYACDPQNVSKAAVIAANDITKLQTEPAGGDELDRAKVLLLQQIVLKQASIDDISRHFLDDADLGLPVDESAIAAKTYLGLSPAQVQSAFTKWMRPGDLVRVTRGPSPQ
jgi:zinc protease